MRIGFACFIATLLLTTTSTGQTATTISPKGAATGGNTNNNIPYSWWPTRYQQLFDKDSFTHGTSVFITRGIAYRMNKSFANGRYGGEKTELEIWLATASQGTTPMWPGP